MIILHKAITWVLLFSFAASPAQFAQAKPKREIAEQADAASAPSVDDDTNTADNVPSTHLAPGFLIQLASGQDSKLNGTFRIQTNGRIDLPYSVSLNTKGMTLAKFRTEIGKAYADYFKGKPNVSIGIRQKRYWVEVLGLVARPGHYLMQQNSPLDEIISSAGGITEDLTSGYIRIEQAGKINWVNLTEYYNHGRQTEVPRWQGAERIFFQKEGPEIPVDPLDAEATRKIQVLGEVKSPGELTFRKEADIYYYLVRSGGPTTNSDLDNVEVVRTDKKSGEREPLSLGPLSDIKNLQGGDLLIFHPSRTSTFEKTLTTTAIITSILTTVLLTVIAVRQTK